MDLLNENSNNLQFNPPPSSGRDPILAFCQNAVAEARLQRYQIEQHHQNIQSLEERVQGLELHKATQLGQDKIVGFLVGAVVLSVLSLVTTFFFRLPEPSPVNASTSSLPTPETIANVAKV